MGAGVQLAGRAREHHGEQLTRAEQRAVREVMEGDGELEVRQEAALREVGGEARERVDRLDAAIEVGELEGVQVQPLIGEPGGQRRGGDEGLEQLHERVGGLVRAGGEVGPLFADPSGALRVDGDLGVQAGALGEAGGALFVLVAGEPQEFVGVALVRERDVAVDRRSIGAMLGDEGLHARREARRGTRQARREAGVAGPLVGDEGRQRGVFLRCLGEGDGREVQRDGEESGAGHDRVSRA